MIPSIQVNCRGTFNITLGTTVPETSANIAINNSYMCITPTIGRYSAGLTIFHKNHTVICCSGCSIRGRTDWVNPHIVSKSYGHNLIGRNSCRIIGKIIFTRIKNNNTRIINLFCNIINRIFWINICKASTHVS